MKHRSAGMIIAVAIIGICGGKSRADYVVATVHVGSGPIAIALDTVTNKIYVADQYANTVTVIDGITYNTLTIPVGTQPWYLAVNPATDKIYVPNRGSNNVTVIDGSTNSTTTVNVGSAPQTIVVNMITNKIYVANGNSSSVTVIDGTTDSATTIGVGANPLFMAINSVTNKIYVPNNGGNTVTVIDGATNATSTVTVGANPTNAAVNPITNKIYVSNSGSSVITIIDGNTLSTVSVNSGLNGEGLAVNSVTNKIFVNNQGSSTVTIIDGATDSVYTIASGAEPAGAAVNTATNKDYVANYGSGTVTIINGATNATSTLTTGNTPGSIELNSLTNYIYVANKGDNTISVIYGSSLPSAPILSSPSNGSINIPLSPTLSWNSSPSATSYEVQLSNSTNFLFVSDTSQTGTARSISSLSLATTYYWRVIASNSYGASPWSVVDSFSTMGTPPAVPILSSPSNGAINMAVTPTLSWGTVANASFYRVQISNSPLFTLVIDTSLAGTSRRVPQLPVSATYYWRVNAGNTYGESAWSDAWSFTTASTGVAGVPAQFMPATLGYDGVIAVYSLTGRQVSRMPFNTSASKASLLRLAGKNLAMGCYRYRFLRNLQAVDDGTFVVR